MVSELIKQEIFANDKWQRYQSFVIRCSQIFKELFFEELASTYTIINVPTDTLSLERSKYHKYTKFKYPTGILLEFEETLESGYTIIPKQPYDE